VLYVSRSEIKSRYNLTLPEGVVKWSLPRSSNLFVVLVARHEIREATSVTHGAQKVGVRARAKERSQPTSLAYGVLVVIEMGKHDALKEKYDMSQN